MQAQRRIGVDVGGSHVSAGIFNDGAPDAPLRMAHRQLDSHAPAETVIGTIAACIGEVMMEGTVVIGIAFPGPFDYKKGVCAIPATVGKFGQLFGLHVKQALQDRPETAGLPVLFANDAHCFALGAQQRMQLQGERTVLLTLGTGFGSAFLVNGELAGSGPGIPASGAFFDQPFEDALADDYFSTRWLLRAFATATGQPITSVREMATAHIETALPIFETFGDNLGAFLRPRLEAFACKELVIGGNIARAAAHFGPALQQRLNGLNIHLSYCPETEPCILAGAAALKDASTKPPARLSSQPLLPVQAQPTEGYNIFPSCKTGRAIAEGFDALAEKIAGETRVVIDGFGGMLWETFRAQLHTALQRRGIPAHWYDVDACLYDTSVIDEIVAASLGGDDPVFGKKYTGALGDFFDPSKLAMLRPASTPGIHIIYGTGAALASPDGLLIYADVPKNEIQYRMRAGCITNIGSETATYKRFYFVDWPVLNLHKASLLPRIAIMADAQREATLTFMTGDDFRASLDELLRTPFRARPWFEAGVWGGNWMKKHLAGLNPDEVNYAWSFELITPENGIVLEGKGLLMEVSFDFLAYRNNQQLLGKAAQRFGTEFPIRFDFLDTYDGGNLSIQCHPRPEYVREHFGENFTQDETYYILDCEPEAAVYLGFQENIDPREFRSALNDAQEKSIPLDVERYVQRFTAEKHGLYLIPNGTVHASGKNNLVLEISSTPYIFTFKMYDWLRPGLNGQPRPIHLDHAFANLYFDRKGDRVPEQLISQPQIARSWDTGRKIHLPTHPEHFYTVDRYEFTGTVEIPTNGQCHICMLVSGSAISVAAGGLEQMFHYAETFVVPAEANAYTCRNEGESPAFLVVAYVKDDHC
ncbi:ROK family protein [Chitinophaga caseinilytica]|uniref:ROK family protein n=1 Tax=Chitinophaga caseinilytica TaxID=2267521 RepID=UPI003C2E5A2A